MNSAWLKPVLLLSLALVLDAAAMTTADNASKAPASKAMPGGGERTNRSATSAAVAATPPTRPGAATEAQRTKSKK